LKIFNPYIEIKQRFLSCLICVVCVLFHRVIPGTAKRMTPQYTPYSKANTPHYALFFYCIYHILRTGRLITTGRMHKGRNNELIHPE